MLMGHLKNTFLKLFSIHEVQTCDLSLCQLCRMNIWLLQRYLKTKWVKTTHIQYDSPTRKLNFSSLQTPTTPRKALWDNNTLNEPMTYSRQTETSFVIGQVFGGGEDTRGEYALHLAHPFLLETQAPLHLAHHDPPGSERVAVWQKYWDTCNSIHLLPLFFLL